MNESSISSYEKDVNRTVAKIMRISSIFIWVALILNFIHIFEIKSSVMLPVCLVSCVLLLIPTYLVEWRKWESPAIKYIDIICAVIMIVLITVTLSYHAVLFYIYPIAIASMYYDRKINVFSLLGTIAGITAGILLDYKFRFVMDNNVLSLKNAIAFAIMPRSLALIAISSIFFQRSDKQAKVIENEKFQHDLIAQMNLMKEKSMEVSKTLLNSVETLSTVTYTTSQANHEIAGNTSQVTQGSSDTLEKLELVDKNISAITNNVDRLLESSNELSTLSGNVYEVTQGNKKVMETAFTSMEGINESTLHSKAIITKLEEKSKEIGKIVDVINEISSQTNLLSLNAAIEAARAGEFGKGFSVVSMEIRKLSEQTKAAVENIAVIIDDVLSATDQASESMNESAQIAKDGLKVIEQAKEATEKVAVANQSMNKKISEMGEITNETSKSSSVICSAVEEAKTISAQNLEDLTSVASSTEEEVATMEELTALVTSIREMAEMLDEVVANK